MTSSQISVSVHWSRSASTQAHGYIGTVKLSRVSISLSFSVNIGVWIAGSG